MPQKRQLSPSSLSSTKNDIFESESIEDRNSTFVAHYSPTASAKSLQANFDFNTASHRIAAWRKPSSQKTIAGKSLFTTGSDDDGEKFAGKKLEKVLNELNAEGAVVVARWYGGTLLGPVRFTHIEYVAKQAIARSRGNALPEPPTKKAKPDFAPAVDDPAETQRLVKQLKDRDNSIITLRQLLSEKQKQGSSHDQSQSAIQAVPSSTPTTTPDYASMTLIKLKQLDKARDATISWILKQIDAAEAKSEPKAGDT